MIMKTKKEVAGKMTLDKLAIMVQKGFMATAKQDDLLALAERVEILEDRMDGHDKEFKGFHQKFDALFLELKEIRKEIKEADTRGDVIDLQIRVDKLEKKIKL